MIGSEASEYGGSRSQLFHISLTSLIRIRTTDLLLQSYYLRISYHSLNALIKLSYLLPCDFALRSSNAAIIPLTRLRTLLIECRCHSSLTTSYSTHRKPAIYPIFCHCEFALHSLNAIVISPPMRLGTRLIECQRHTSSSATGSSHPLVECRGDISSHVTSHSVHQTRAMYLLFCHCEFASHSLNAIVLSSPLQFCPLNASGMPPLLSQLFTSLIKCHFHTSFPILIFYSKALSSSVYCLIRI